MFSELNNGSGGSGGNTASSSSPDSTTSSGQVVTISTGLSSISRFVLTGYLTGDRTRCMLTTTYDTSEATKQVTAHAYSAGSYNVTAYTDFATSHQYNIVITGISGGNVTIKVGTASGWGAVTYEWFAEQ